MKASAVGKRCTEVERAYIAGFLDADGAIMAIIEPHSGKQYGFRVRVSLKVTQHDRKILDWIRHTIGVGIVRANRLGTHRQTFDLHIRDQTHVAETLELLMPYMRTKGKQAHLALEILFSSRATKKEILHVARLADTLSKFNVRSKNRRKNFAAKVHVHLSSND
jgi:hypothetical protein